METALHIWAASALGPLVALQYWAKFLPFHLKATGLPSSLSATISGMPSPSRSPSAGVVLARMGGLLIVSSSLQSFPLMMRSTPVVIPLSAVPALNETKTISAELGSLGRSATTGELATKLLASSVHSHWIWGENTPTTAVPLHAMPGGTLPGMQTPMSLPSLRQSPAQQYVSP